MIELLIVPIVALLLAWGAGFLTQWIINHAFADLGTPNKLLDGEWDKMRGVTDSAGRWIGFFERLLVVLCFSYSAFALLAGWFAIKLGAKWNAWTSISRIPTTYSTLTNEEWFLIRRSLASWTSMRFLLGTIANIVFGWAIFIVLGEILQVLGSR